MRIAPLLSLLTLAIGCTDDSVILSGRVGDGPELDAPGLEGAEVEIVDLATQEPLVVGTTNANGQFNFLLPPGLTIAALVRSADTVTTSFVGATGFIDVTIDDGTLYGLSSELVTDWRSDFEGCPGSDSRVMLFGRMEFSNISGKKGGESPIAGGGRAQLLTDDAEYLACYLDPETETYDPKGDRTGATGRFAIFDVPGGPSTLDVVFEWAPDLFDTPGFIPVWTPDTDEEVVVPYLPLRLELPAL